MPHDVWSEDRNERSIALQQRSDAVEEDRTPSIPALAPMPPDPKPKGVLLRNTLDNWVALFDEDEVADLIASGVYRPIEADDSYNESGTLTTGADPDEIEAAQRERIAALARLQSQQEERAAVVSDIAAMQARIASLTEEEREALVRELIQPIAGVSAGLVRPAMEG